MGYLFSKDNVQQSLRLGFAGAWEEAFPDLAIPLSLVQNHCPGLVQSFVPPPERVEATADDSEEEEDLDTLDTAWHSNVILDMKGYAAVGTAAERALLLGKAVGILSTANATLSQALRDAFDRGMYCT